MSALDCCMICGNKLYPTYQGDGVYLQEDDTCEPCKMKRARKPVVLIESPYAGQISRNTEYARACMKDSLDRGEAPIVPHLLYTQVYSDDDPGLRESSLLACEALRHVVSLVAFYDDFGISPGMKRALSEAEKAGQNVEFRKLNLEGMSLIDRARWRVDGITVADFECLYCAAMEGFFVEKGFKRCNICGEPGQ